DVVPLRAQRRDEVRHGRAGADADHHAVLHVAHRGLGGGALLLVAGHGTRSSARIASYCSRVTGSTESRLPRRSRAKSPSSAAWRLSCSSGTGRFSLRTYCTSTAVQRGSSFGDFGS